MKEYVKPELVDTDNRERIATFAAAALAAKAIGVLAGYFAARAVVNSSKITGTPPNMTGLEQVLAYE